MTCQKNVARDIALVAIPAIVLTIFIIFVIGTASRPDGNDPTPPAEYEAAIAKTSDVCSFLSPGQEGENLVAAQIYTGSGYRAEAVSPAGAAGPAQLMPSTMELKGVDGNGDGIVDAHNIDDAVATLAELNCENAAKVRKGLDEGLLHGDQLDLTIATYFAGFELVQSTGGEVIDGNPTVSEEIARVREAMAKL